VKISRIDPLKFSQVIERLHRECFPSDALCELEGIWWLAKDGATPVAFAAMKASAQWGDAAYLSRCGVLASHRGQGLQRKLIRVREAAARSQGLRWLITDTRRNPASVNNLTRAGFQMYEPSRPWSFKDALYWKKKLDNRNS
jgi:GNAT superfamily N-acetyltransferase